MGHAEVSEAMRVLDMQDFHALRLGRERALCMGLAASATHRPDAGSEDLLRELSSIHRCDLTFAISAEERELLVETYGVPCGKVIVAPILYAAPPPPLASLKGFSDRRHAMFIGNWRHKPNRDCAQWLISEVWPRVRLQLLSVELHVYGANPTPEDMALTDKRNGVTVCGYCRDVFATMQQHRLLVAPLRFGAGVKGKLTDAMRNGLVTVTTPIGAEGLGGEGGFPGFVVSTDLAAAPCFETVIKDAEAFANTVVRAYENASIWTTFQMRGHKFVDEHCNTMVIGEKIWASVEDRLLSLVEARKKDFTGQLLWQNSLRSTEWMAKALALKEEVRVLNAVAAMPTQAVKE